MVWGYVCRNWIGNEGMFVEIGYGMRVCLGRLDMVWGYVWGDWIWYEGMFGKNSVWGYVWGDWIGYEGMFGEIG